MTAPRVRRGHSPGLELLILRGEAYAVLRDAESATIPAAEALLVLELDLLDMTRNEPSCWARTDVDDWAWAVPLALEDPDSEW